jgi:hypothetical protein
VDGKSFQARDISGDVNLFAQLPQYHQVPLLMDQGLPPKYESRFNTLVIMAVLLTVASLALLGLGIAGEAPVLSIAGGAALVVDCRCLWQLWRHTEPVRRDRK